MNKLIDLTGQRFGRWTVRCRDINHKGTYWICDCDCGNTNSVRGNALTSGKSLSCGCFIGINNVKVHTKHGDSHARLYNTWANIKDRCFNKNHQAYNRYGGRGITMCDEWKSYVAFREWASTNGYTDELTIDRIDVNGNYEPNNCRWVTMKTQQNNRRDNKYLEYDNKKLTYAQWGELLGINPQAIAGRITRGLTIEEALEKKFSENVAKHLPRPVVRLIDNKYFSSLRDAELDSGIFHSSIVTKISKGEEWRDATKEEIVRNEKENSPALHKIKYLEKFGRD